VLNLAANAVKFAPSGRVVVRVGPAAERTSGSNTGPGWLHITISDTGPGIPEELQAALFERPGGPEGESARRYGGSGLELAISNGIDGRHHWCT
jgi:signal transduction histidine kinase